MDFRNYGSGNPEEALREIDHCNIGTLKLAPCRSTLEPERNVKTIEPRCGVTDQPGSSIKVDVPIEPDQAKPIHLLFGYFAEGVVKAVLQRARFPGIENRDLRLRPGHGSRPILTEELSRPKGAPKASFIS